MNTPTPLSAQSHIVSGQGVGRALPNKPRNSCHRCGATAYRTLIARDQSGAMRPSGQYQCVQCRQVFRHVREWRDGDGQNPRLSTGQPTKP
jgi:hypothetical protein